MTNHLSISSINTFTINANKLNVTNASPVEKLLENVTKNSRFLYAAFNAFTPEDTVAFFERLGVDLKTERGMRVFPVSDKASDIVNALKSYTDGCEIIYQKGKIDALYRDRLYEVSASTVEVPVMASLRLWDGMLRVNGGVSFGVLSSSGYLDGYESYMFGPITPTWNLTAGVGVYVARMALVDLRYSHALQDNINQIGGARGEAGLDFSSRTHKVSLGVTILF